MTNVIFEKSCAKNRLGGENGFFSKVQRNKKRMRTTVPEAAQGNIAVTAPLKRGNFSTASLGGCGEPPRCTDLVETTLWGELKRMANLSTSTRGNRKSLHVTKIPTRLSKACKPLELRQ